MSTNPTDPVAVKILRRAADPRGWLCEPLEAAEFAGQRNVHLVFTRPGGVRGNHFHRRTTEIMTVAGPALVRLRIAGQDRDFLIPAHEAHRFTLPPGVPHAILNTGTEPGVTLSFADQVHDPANPDTIREILIEPPAGS
ncbi:MAG: cupin domain-containing protein [Verrucomicrobiota bacterium]|jgi:dTDP-4-dehydrorhamnose 3,5-epimerase-like enzyme